jgi:hypothetical protein
MDQSKTIVSLYSQLTLPSLNQMQVHRGNSLAFQQSPQHVLITQLLKPNMCIDSSTCCVCRQGRLLEPTQLLVDMRFILKYIQSTCTQLARFECLHKIGFVDQRTTCDIDESTSSLELLELPPLPQTLFCGKGHGRQSSCSVQDKPFERFCNRYCLSRRYRVLCQQGLWLLLESSCERRRARLGFRSERRFATMRSCGMWR